MGGIPYLTLGGQKPNKRVIENENLISHLTYAGMGQSHYSIERMNE